MKKMILISCVAMASLFGENAIRVVEVKPTAEPDSVTVRVVFPQRGNTARTDPVDVEIKMEGYSVGVMSDTFERRKEIKDDKRGQSLHVVIDNDPYFAVYEPTVDSYNEDEDYFISILNFTLPYRLDPGLHIIRVFPARSFNECLKNPGCLDASYFYSREKTGSFPTDLNKPFLTYNEPQGKFKMGKPILLDFYISNTELSMDGYKVRLIIDENNKRLLTKWIPYYIYGLKPGSHTIRLQLLDSKSQPVAGNFNDVTRTIVVE